MVGSDIKVRMMKEEEKERVSSAMRSSFSKIAYMFFSLSPNVLVGEKNGEIVGAVVLKMFKISATNKGGLIAWIFTVPEVRGLGLGEALAEAGIDFLEEQGCQEIFAAIEGYNASSSKLFASRGFEIISPGQQLRCYGLRIFNLWLKTFHLIDVGHFLWRRPALKKDNPSLQFWGTIAITSLIWLLIIWRNSGEIKLINWLAYSGATIVLFGLRYLFMKLAARQQGLEVRYRAWESGFPLSIVIAAASGGPYLIPGGLYPTKNDWRYKELFPQLLRMALAGILSVLILIVLISLYAYFVTPELSIWFKAILNVGVILLFFDTCLPFFPFNCYNGRRVWEWNKPIWLILTIVVISLMYLH